MNNPGFQLSLHRRTALLGVETVRAVFGEDAEDVLRRVEEGSFQWVWDIATRPGSAPDLRAARTRELRFWARELMAPDLCLGMHAVEVVEMMLGSRRGDWRASEAAHLLLCSRAVVMRLARCHELEGTVAGRVRWITRDSLAAFLLRRRVC